MTQLKPQVTAVNCRDVKVGQLFLVDDVCYRRFLTVLRSCCSCLLSKTAADNKYMGGYAKATMTAKDIYIQFNQTSGANDAVWVHKDNPSDRLQFSSLDSGLTTNVYRRRWHQRYIHRL